MDKNFLNGKWAQTGTVNMDEFLKWMGYSWPVRKIAGSMSVTLIIDGHSGDGIKSECFFVFLEI